MFYFYGLRCWCGCCMLVCWLCWVSLIMGLGVICVRCFLLWWFVSRWCCGGVDVCIGCLFCLGSGFGVLRLRWIWIIMCGLVYCCYGLVLLSCGCWFLNYMLVCWIVFVCYGRWIWLRVYLVGGVWFMLRFIMCWWMEFWWCGFYNGLLLWICISVRCLFCGRC